MLYQNLSQIVKNSQTARLIEYFIVHTDGDTKLFKRTYKEIQADTGISQVTIANAMKHMESTGAAEYLGNSTWRNNMVLDYTADYNDGFEFTYFQAENPFK